jgi:hypothetical protein
MMEAGRVISSGQPDQSGHSANGREAIAIIGVGCRFPGGVKNVHDFGTSEKQKPTPHRNSLRSLEIRNSILGRRGAGWYSRWGGFLIPRSF